MIRSEVLVLNKSFQPVNVIDLKRGLCMLYTGLAHALDEQYQMFDFESWQSLSVETRDDCIGTTAGVLKIPRILVLQAYNRIPVGRVRFSRRNIYARDGSTCQYCGKTGASSEFNLDHVIPRSQGGKTTWENVVCSCVKCNSRKGGRTPEQAGMRLLSRPKRPSWHELGRKSKFVAQHDSWLPFIDPANASYWNTELIEE